MGDDSPEQPSPPTYVVMAAGKGVAAGVLAQLTASTNTTTELHVMVEQFNGHPVFVTYDFDTLTAPYPCPDHALIEMGHYGACTGIVYCPTCWATAELPEGACSGEHW